MLRHCGDTPEIITALSHCFGLFIVLLHNEWPLHCDAAHKRQTAARYINSFILGVKQNLLIGDSIKEYIGFVHAHGKPTQVI